ncbi:MAG: CsbD family protein [Alphaproteobacteria bacterium]|nr:CsbD family protein [Alphaproteobacteria bacterium]
MNNEQISGKFEQLKGEIKKTWGKLTDDEVMLYNGNQEKFFGKLKERYGLAKEAAEAQIKEFEKNAANAPAAEKAVKTA